MFKIKEFVIVNYQQLKLILAVGSSLILFWNIGFAYGKVNMQKIKEENMTLEIKSSAFKHNGDIPAKYTCEGDDVSIPLSWSGVPENAKSLVLIIDDPDAPDPGNPKMTWVHWILYNIPPNASGLKENISVEELPEGTLEGINDWKKTGYGGPCPPIGKHRYFHKLYALDIVLNDLNKPTKDQLEKEMAGHIIENAEIIGLYKK